MSRYHPPEEFTLSNGIPVIFQEYEGPVAACYWWNNVGSADEKPNQAGFAHFLEHMLFKDAGAKETGQASEGKLARAIESLGGDINAYTSFDQTVYHVTCAEHHWERVFDAFATMAKPQRFLKSDFIREREVILEELRKNDDSPSRQLFEKLFEKTFRTHPYGRPVIGYARTLKAATVGTLEHFYRSHYRSTNMGLILVGPFDEARKKKLLSIAEKRFGRAVYKPQPDMRPTRPAEKSLRPSEEIALLPFDVKTPSLAIAFRAPALRHADVPALDLLAGILGNGEASRLYQKLFYELSIATEVSAGLYIPKDDGMLYVQAETDSMEKLQPMAEALFAEIARVTEHLPTSEEIERVIVNVESEKLYATQSADGLASRIGNLRFTIGDLGFDREFLEALRRVTPAEVGRIASKYFDFRRLGMIVMVPKSEKKFDVRPIREMARKYFSPVSAVGSPAVRKSSTKRTNVGFRLPVETVKTRSGVRVALIDRPHSPVFSVYAVSLGGVRSELLPGVSHAMAQTWTKGTPTKDSKTISTWIEGKAAGMDGFSGRNSAGIQLTGLARDWESLSPLFTEVLAEANFPESEIQHTKRVAEEQLRSIEDHSSQLCSKLFLSTLFEHHPYGRTTLGDLESLARMDQNAVRDAHLRLFDPKNIVLSVSGPIERAHLIDWIDSIDLSLAGLFAENGDRTRAPKEELELTAPRWVEKSLGREQVHIMVGGLGIRQHSEDRYALRVLQNILGGQSGRLFIELREKKSLAYTVSPLSFEGIERGYLGTYIACAPSKKEESIRGIREVLERLAKRGPSASELNRAKEYYLGQRAMELQSDASLSAHYGLQLLYGFDPKEEHVLFERISAVNSKSIREVLERYYLKPYMVTASVG